MKTPNVVIVMTDQQQARACKREGFPLDTTPFLDSLAEKGVWFNKAYTSAPLCAPARVSMLTGRYAQSHGVRANPTLHADGMPRYTRDIVDVLQEKGYATAMVGKNHSHLDPQRVDYWSHYGHSAGYGREDSSPEEKAFDEWINDLHHGVSKVAAPFPVECQGPWRVARDAGNWLKQLDTDRPFFMWLTFAEPHNPFQVPEPYFSMFPQESHPPIHGNNDSFRERGFKWDFVGQLGRQGLDSYEELLPFQRQNYYGMLRLIDDQVKRFAGVLDELGRLEGTLIFFVADHGDFVGDYGLMRKGPEMPEDLMRMPFLAAGPGIQQHDGPHPAHVSLVDLMPTVCEAVGADCPEGVQGRSLWPLLAGQDYPASEFSSAYSEQGFGGLDYNWEDNPDFAHCSMESINFDCLNRYTQCGIMRMIRKDRWKLVYDMQGKGQLYDLESDPGEMHDLFHDTEHAATRHALVEELLAWTLRAQDPLPYPGGRYVRKNHPRNYWKQD